MEKIIIIYILVFIILLLFNMTYSFNNSSSDLSEYFADNISSSITDSSYNVPNTSNITDSSYNVPNTLSSASNNSYNVPNTSSSISDSSYNVPTTSSSILDSSYNVPNTLSSVPTTSSSDLVSSYNVSNILSSVPTTSSMVPNTLSSVTTSMVHNTLSSVRTTSVPTTSVPTSSSVPTLSSVSSLLSIMPYSLSNSVDNKTLDIIKKYIKYDPDEYSYIDNYNNNNNNNNNNDNNNNNNNNLDNTSNNGLMFFYKILQSNIKNNLLANIAQSKIYDAAIINDISNIIDYNVNTNNNIIDYTFRNKNDGSIYFSGNLNYIQIPAINFNNTGITIACYFYIKYSQKAIHTAVLFDLGSGFSNNNITITINENNIFNKIVVYKDRMPYTAYFYLNDIQNYKWNHLAFVITDYPIWYLYFNGKPIQLSMNSSFIYPSIVERTTNFIGKNNNEEYSSGTYIDEFRIYNKSLSQDEIISIM